MKKIIAKGMAAFLIMVLMVLTLLAPVCYAAEENGNYSVEVHITHTPVHVEVDEESSKSYIEDIGICVIVLIFCIINGGFRDGIFYFIIFIITLGILYLLLPALLVIIACIFNLLIST